MVIIRATLTLLLVTVLFTTSNGAGDLTPENYRLKNTIKPNHYEISIEPKFNGQDFDSFEGEVKITADIDDDADVTDFRIHIGCNIEAKDSSFKIRYKGEDKDIADVKIEKDEGYGDCKDNIQGDKEGNDFYIITVPGDSLDASKELEISLAYSALFPPGMYGFYKSYYTDEEEKERVLLTTQFESTHARKAFPCFDEPGFKAQFTLTFKVPDGYHVISNAIEDEDKKDGETNTVKFKTTTMMSTYLVAFVVFHKDTFSKTSTGEDDYLTSTWGRKPEIDAGAGNLSQKYVPLILDSMNNYSDISYLLTQLGDEMPNKPEKVDQVAIPDFSAGAMENWGLVTYRETALLYKEGKHSETAKKRVVEVIAHELAHQWFGNLVTTQWWNSAWLNEGFATLFEYYLTEDVTKGEWRMMERFIADDQIKALGVDAYDTAPPLTIPEEELLTGSQASSHFGTITYSKGGSVLRMFQNIVGPEEFQEAIKQYLKNMAWKPATPSDLFKELDKGNVPHNLTEIFERWTTQKGFPLIMVEKKENVTVSQKRYLIGEGNNDTKYDVKITLSSNAEEDIKDFWLTIDTDSEVVNVPNDKWVLVKTTGFFRVKYFKENWELLIKELEVGKDTKIEPVERAVLVDNALNLARFGELEYEIAIDVLNYLQQENDFIPWYTASIELNFLHRMLVNSEKDDDTINKYIQRIIENVYENVKEIKDDHISKVHRANIFNWACRVGHEECLDKVKTDFQNYINESGMVDPDIMNTVYCYGVQTNDKAWLQLWDKLDKEEDAITRSVIISALGCSKNQLSLALYLEMGILRGAIRTQDAPAVFSSVYTNPDGIEVALQFLETKIKQVQQNVETVMNGLPNMISGIAQYLTTESQKARMTAIGEKEESVKADTQKAVNTIEANIKWKTNNEEKVLQILQEKMSPGSAGAKQPAVIMLTITFIICVFLL